MEVVHVLLSAGSKVDLQTKDGDSPLYASCQAGHTEVVRSLLSAGAKFDLQNLDPGRSPLHVACQARHTEVVRPHPAISWSQGRLAVQ